MPNGDVKGGLQACAVSIDSVESVTGHDFFSALPDSIEQQVEQECRFHYWSTIRAK
jgi:endonuclease G